MVIFKEDWSHHTVQTTTKYKAGMEYESVPALALKQAKKKGVEYDDTGTNGGVEAPKKQPRRGGARPKKPAASPVNTG